MFIFDRDTIKLKLKRGDIDKDFDFIFLIFDLKILYLVEIFLNLKFTIASTFL